MNFRAASLIFFDRQFFPLTTRVKQSQDVVEYCMQWQRWRRAFAAGDKMGQDKFLKLRQRQSHRNPLPALAFRHFDRPKQSDFSLFD